MDNLRDCKDAKARSLERAEEASLEVISSIRPSSASEAKRKAVIDYVQSLLEGYLGCKFLPFGSAPLKTYLPDGDIDLTIVGFMISQEEHLAHNVFSILESQRCRRNGPTEFSVEDVQYVAAEVKLVKCLINKIAVDISFNQIGGLSTVCFLEKVDRFIGRESLFKRSIILIKAWCYYESRILGSHYGLLSTYALETMVLYIFQMFHSSLNSPLSVLYKFLDYYSKFNWDKYCISLSGPVQISSLPEFVDSSEISSEHPILNRRFLKECIETLSARSEAGLCPKSHTIFSPKHINIVDPLKKSNNLGRSVSKGNYVRIRSAISLGARRLEKVLLQPEESIFHELGTFFGCTLARVSDTNGNLDSSYKSKHIHKEVKNYIDGISGLEGNYESMLNNLQFGRCCYMTSRVTTSKPRGTGAYIPDKDHCKTNWETYGRQTEGKLKKNSETSRPGTGSFVKHGRSTCSDTPRMIWRRVPERTINLENEDEFPSLSTVPKTVKLANN